MLDLTVHFDQRPVSIQDVAERQNIPLKYLEQILLALKLAGFVRSRKGPGGGYFLAKSPGEITLGAVVRAMDGPLAPLSCASVSGYHECGCPEPETCSLRATFKAARDALSAVLDGTTFADLKDRREIMSAGFLECGSVPLPAEPLGM
jgi:Rrf2 family protein